MALIDVGITRDEALAPGAQVPAGRYVAEYMGLLQNQEEGGVIFISRNTGSKMVKARFRVVQHSDPLVCGKNLPIYNAVVGEFSFSNLIDAVPAFWGPSGPDSEAGIGTVVNAVVGPGKGEYAEVNGIKNISRIK